MGQEGGKFTELSQDYAQWRVLVQAVLNLARLLLEN
jgi:hypothetical protein